MHYRTRAISGGAAPTPDQAKAQLVDRGLVRLAVDMGLGGKAFCIKTYDPVKVSGTEDWVAIAVGWETE